MSKYKYTKEILEEIVPRCLSWSAVCRELNIPPASGSQTNLTRRAKEFGIDSSHFTGQLWSKGKTLGPKRPIEEYLVEKSTCSSLNLKKRLFKEGILEDKCSVCGISEWQGETGVCELDHINSDHFDNRLENLQILCPNCHAVKTKRSAKERRDPTKAEARRVKNSAYRIPKTDRRKGVVRRSNIKRDTGIDGRTVRRDRPELRKIERPSAEELLTLLWSKPTIHVAQEFGVCDQAVAKWARSYGIAKPPRGYWLKSPEEQLKIKENLNGRQT